MTARDERPLAVRLKNKKKRTVSQKRWLERQLNDPYVARAKREGMRSRAAYKLIEVDDKYRLLKPGARVVDLGAAPGGWSDIAAKRVGAAEGRGKVVAIDILEMAPIAGVTFRQIDFLDHKRLSWLPHHACCDPHPATTLPSSGHRDSIEPNARINRAGSMV